jgi:hypothetical protein
MIRQTLVDKLGMNADPDFNLSGSWSPNEIGSDCYVKLGADAVAFSDQTQDILRSPNGSDLVFVQANTSTPLASCLEASAHFKAPSVRFWFLP